MSGARPDPDGGPTSVPAPPPTGTRHPRTLLIGVTGPIGCGKSQVARWLTGLGATAIDADRVAREVTAPGTPAHDAILVRFGPAATAVDGTVDRAALGRLVFADPAALRDLEAIVHPAVRPRILAAMAQAEASGAPAVIIEAIKLVEGGLAGLCDEVWLVTCDTAAQRERLAARGMEPAAAEQRLAAQAGMTERLRRSATRVLDTSGGAGETRELVAGAFGLALAGAARAAAGAAGGAAASDSAPGVAVPPGGGDDTNGDAVDG